MKKNANRLQSLDAAQLAQVSGGAPNTAEFYGMINEWGKQIVPGQGEAGLNSFWSGAIKGAVSPPPPA